MSGISIDEAGMAPMQAGTYGVRDDTCMSDSELCYAHVCKDFKACSRMLANPGLLAV